MYWKMIIDLQENFLNQDISINLKDNDYIQTVIKLNILFSMKIMPFVTVIWTKVNVNYLFFI